MLKRKIDSYLQNWKLREDRQPLIVKGARQIGKTESIKHFAEQNYKSVVKIDFALEEKYLDIFQQGFEVDAIIKNISAHDTRHVFIPGETLIFFDELQKCPSAATSLKAFKLDGRYDVICSGSLMGIYYNEIESNSVGYKEDYNMYSMDFEEFLWAKGYSDEFINDLLKHMVEVKPLSEAVLLEMQNAFKDYMMVGGMPAVVDRFIKQGHFSGILQMQRQLLNDYEEDITKYASGMDQTRILNIYRRISVFLGQDNKKFRVSKVAKGARGREYIGAVEWLENAGIINVCYCMLEPSLPLKGNYNPDNYKIYFGDTGLLIASLDDEAQMDLRDNRNFNAYKGAIYENIIAETIQKQSYPVYFYKNEKSTVEMDFMLRDKSGIVPIEVKAKDGATASMNAMTRDNKKEKYSDVVYGIKFADKNIGFNGQFYTFPYSLAFLLRRFFDH
ncbi:MAG: ATP-binding protein [Lachnospiraceae bacterium]|nr:ATP-binding protein [Lachnospiraceae bacterium]